MNILIVGYAFIRKTHRDTFDFYPEKNSISFLVPRIWKTKGGRAVFSAPEEENIFSGRAFFSHSHYPLIGGLLKAIIPAFPLILWRAKRSKKIELVHVCSELTLLTTLYYALWSRLLGLPFTLFSWENVRYEDKFKGINLFLKQMVVRMNLKLSSGLVCGNIKCAEMHRKYMDSKSILVAPMNGVDPNFFQPSTGQKVFQNVDYSAKIVFTFVGAVERRKGIDAILKVFPQVHSQIPMAHLIIAGGGQDDAVVEEQVTLLQMPEHITRIPYLSHEELIKLLHVSDVFVYPSLSYHGWEEQFGYSMAEASLMELPVITTRTGSIEEVVVHDHTGITVDPNDLSGLQEAMIRLGADEPLRHKLGHEGRNYIVEHFSHEVIAQKFYTFFSEVKKTARPISP
ncbi:MAG: glycosyltransferase family 4 protein [Candidatus Yanofskybacteria bacterium]|nr:glycosyltransferase family 4 protein [Candidatus Yanofskybacteria bacterium]